MPLLLKASAQPLRAGICFTLAIASFREGILGWKKAGQNLNRSAQDRFLLHKHSTSEGFMHGIMALRLTLL